MADDEDIIDEPLGEEPEDEQEIVGPERGGNGGLSDESREAIHGAFGNGPDKTADKEKDLSRKQTPEERAEQEKLADEDAARINAKKQQGQEQGGDQTPPAPASGAKPAENPQPNAGNNPSGGSRPPAAGSNNKSPVPASGAAKAPAATPSPKTSGGSAGRGANLAQGAQIGANLARNPQESVKEAGKAAVSAAGRKVVEEGAKRAAELLLSETVIVPLIIEGLNALNGAIKKVPGAGKALDWINRHKPVTVIALVLLWASPALAFVAMLGGGTTTVGECDGETINGATYENQPFIPVDGMFFPMGRRPMGDFGSGSSRGFGDSRSGGKRHHAGVDLLAPVGTPILAVADGVIVNHYSFYSGTYATFIDHGSFVINYGENSGLAPGLKVGDAVKAGDIIGRVGRLGSGASMIHFEMYAPGTRSNSSWWGNNRPSNLYNATDFVNRLLGGFSGQ